MFTRSFFERDFVRLVESYAHDKKSETPVVELHLRDGSRHYVESIELVGEDWISFRTAPEPGRSNDGKQPDQITCPYNMISRVNFLPRLAESRVGFRINR
jgi:hypothetical protein